MSTNSAYFLLWGWLTFAACTTQFILISVGYKEHYNVWFVVFVGFAFTIYWGIRDRRKRKVKTYFDDSMAALWTGMGISFGVLSMILSKIGWGSNVFPFFILLYGLGTFVSGSLLKFKPLIVGGVIAWILAVVGVMLPYQYQILTGATAILVSYIIPGHLLQKQHRQK